MVSGVLKGETSLWQPFLLLLPEFVPIYLHIPILDHHNNNTKQNVSYAVTLITDLRINSVENYIKPH
jgi:hypothetical protein